MTKDIVSLTVFMGLRELMDVKWVIQIKCYVPDKR